MTYAEAAKHNLRGSHLSILFHPPFHTSSPPNFTMSVIEISSKQQFSSLLTSSRLVVADCKYLLQRDPAPPRPCLPFRTTRAIANLGLIFE